MKFSSNITPGTELTNKEICDIFGCSLFGGMNRSHKTNTLVLISNPIKSIYKDRIEGNVIHYTGMGQIGPQNLKAAQNKTLNESDLNGVGIHLFEVIDSGKYIYTGQVQLAGKPYQEVQKDTKGDDRTVWMFPLHLSNHTNFMPIRAEKIRNIEILRERNAGKLSHAELQARANQAPKIPGAREIISKQYQRNEYVAEEARRRANGVCQLCEKTAPFKNKYGQPHLEIHHIFWLARGGEDSLGNTVALCPNCHRKMHVLDLETDKEILKRRISS